MPRTPSLAAFTDALLTRHPPMRRQLALWLTSVITYLLYTGLLWLQVWLGFTPATMAWALMATATIVNTFFYFGIRHGWGPASDRNLGSTQLVVGIVFMWVSYAAAGPVAGALMIIVASHIVYAMFSMSPWRVWRLVAFSLAVLRSPWCCATSGSPRATRPASS